MQPRPRARIAGVFISEMTSTRSRSPTSTACRCRALDGIGLTMLGDIGWGNWVPLSRDLRAASSFQDAGRALHRPDGTAVDGVGRWTYLLHDDRRHAGEHLRHVARVNLRCASASSPASGAVRRGRGRLCARVRARRSR